MNSPQGKTAKMWRGMPQGIWHRASSVKMTNSQCCFAQETSLGWDGATDYKNSF